MLMLRMVVGVGVSVQGQPLSLVQVEVLVEFCKKNCLAAIALGAEDRVDFAV
jgi:hypothetical protein